MPSLRGSIIKSTGTVGAARTFMKVLREMSFDQVREEAERVPRLLVMAPNESTAAEIGRLLTGLERSPDVAVRSLSDGVRGSEHDDAIVVFDPEDSGAFTRVGNRLMANSATVPIFLFGGKNPKSERIAAAVRAAIAQQLPDRAPAFGRCFPAFRVAAAKALIDEASRANAQFALVSNIPAAIPIVGSLAAAGADFFVLTKNQLMLIFKLAAVHGRDLHDQWGIMREMIPVVGAGLLWRTIAREAASFLPLAAGTIPKIGIAYVGTMAAGRAADLYYRIGHKPTREDMRLYYQQASDALKKLPLPQSGGDPKS